MKVVKIRSSAVALIGDLVDSRESPDRQSLHTALDDVLRAVNQRLDPIVAAVITVGDEFQGVYRSVGDALTASFWVRLSLRPVGDVRFGVGRGDVRTLDTTRGILDGSAFWRARDAIEAAERRAGRARTRTSRTAYQSPDDPPHHVATIQATLDCLDFMIGSLTSPSDVILEGLMNGRTQLEIAERAGISASAVSQRVRRDGLGVALDTMTTLGSLP